MMQDFGWEEVQTRRQQNTAVMMYRIVKIPTDQYLTAAGV